MYKILVADDEALEREVLIYLLKNHNLEEYEIIECDNGKAALSLVLTEKPDILLLDIQMPGLSGLEVLEQARLEGIQAKAIFLTAFDNFEYAVKALKLQAKDFLVKPIEEENFIAVLQDAIDQIEEEKLKVLIENKKENLLRKVDSTYFKKVILGEIDEEVMDFFQIQNISYESAGNCICVKIAETQEKEQEVQSKNELQKLFQANNFYVLLNYQNSMLTVLYMKQADSEGEVDENEIQDTFVMNLLKAFFVNHKLTYQAVIGKGFEDLSGIEQCYNHTREKFGDIKKTEEAPREDKLDENNVPKELVTVRQYLEQNYEKKITLEELADLVGFTKYYLSRLYKKHYLENIMDCLIRIRMEKAKEILKTGEKNVKQVGLLVGYTDANYFTWSFKKYTGETPIRFQQDK